MNSLVTKVFAVAIKGRRLYGQGFLLSYINVQPQEDGEAFPIADTMIPCDQAMRRADVQPYKCTTLANAHP